MSLPISVHELETVDRIPEIISGGKDNSIPDQAETSVFHRFPLLDTGAARGCVGGIAATASGPETVRTTHMLASKQKRVRE